MKISIVTVFILALAMTVASERKYRACAGALVSLQRLVCRPHGARWHHIKAVLRRYPSLRIAIRSRREVFSDDISIATTFTEAMDANQGTKSVMKRFIKTASEMNDLRGEIDQHLENQRRLKREIVNDCCHRECTESTMRQYC